MVADYASYLADNGYDVCFDVNELDTIFPINQKIKIVPIILTGKLGTIVSSLCIKRSPGIVIADIIPLAVSLYFRNRKNVVYFAQDYNETQYKNPLLKFFIRFLYYVGLSIFKIPTIAVSHEIGHILFEKFNAHVSVVPNGVDTSNFYREPSEALQAERNGRKAILILSRGDRRKGFDIAQRVINKLISSCDIPFEVWTIGETAEGKLSGVIHRDFGYVQEAELRAILSSANLLLYPSRSEGFPLLVMEAFACKCPVVTTEAVSYAMHEVNAMVSKVEDVNSLSDQIARLLVFQDAADNIIENAYTYALTHRLDIARVQFENALRSYAVR